MTYKQQVPSLDSGESLLDPKDTVAQGVTPSSLLEAVLGWDTGKANTQWNPVTPGPPCPGPSQPPTKFRERFLIFSTPNICLPGLLAHHLWELPESGA